MSDLVLGAAGFLGRNVVTALARAGRVVRAADRAFPSPLSAGANVERHVVDLRDMDASTWAVLMEGVRTIYHCAWSTIPATAAADPRADLVDNVGVTLALFEAVADRDLVVVFCSSGGTVYGDAGRLPIVENARLQPITSYGAGKAAVELYAGAYRRTARAGGADIRIARISNLFGAGQSQHRRQGALSRFVHDALAGRPLIIWGTGDIVRDYIHVSDAARGLVALGDAASERLDGHATFNFGSGVGTSLNELVNLLEGILGRRIPVERTDGRSLDIPFNMLDVSRARDVLGWSPALDLEAGVRLMVADLAAASHLPSGRVL